MRLNRVTIILFISKRKVMASKRCLNTLTRHCPSLFSSNTLLQNVIALSSCPQISVTDPLPFENPSTNLHYRSGFQSFCSFQSTSIRNFSYQRRTPGKVGDEDDDDDDDVDDDDDEAEGEEGELSETSDGEYIDSDVSVTKPVVHRTYSVEEKEQEAAAIGYNVIGPLDPSERPFKPWEPVFAVVQIGSHQFKISNGDSIYTERLKFCEVNDKLILSKVLMVGSKSQTIIGRPILPDATVHAVVEEHALDAKVIIFKKKRRKNYRRTNGHRQELTRLRITKIEGVEIPEKEAIAA